jgi:hypothetical protein
LFQYGDEARSGAINANAIAPFEQHRFEHEHDHTAATSTFAEATSAAQALAASGIPDARRVGASDFEGAALHLYHGQSRHDELSAGVARE